jgi:hypothetical protein
MLELLPLRLGSDGHATPEDDVNLYHLLITIRICMMLINSLGLLWRRHCWCWHLLDHASRCRESCITSLRHWDAEKASSPSDRRTASRSICGPSVLEITSISCVDLTIFLLP